MNHELVPYMKTTISYKCLLSYYEYVIIIHIPNIIVRCIEEIEYLFRMPTQCNIHKSNTLMIRPDLNVGSRIFGLQGQESINHFPNESSGTTHEGQHFDQLDQIA